MSVSLRCTDATVDRGHSHAQACVCGRMLRIELALVSQMCSYQLAGATVLGVLIVDLQETNVLVQAYTGKHSIANTIK